MHQNSWSAQSCHSSLTTRLPYASWLRLGIITEEILREKVPIELKHILKPREDGTPVCCVLVEGAPGIGINKLLCVGSITN